VRTFYGHEDAAREIDFWVADLSYWIRELEAGLASSRERAVDLDERLEARSWLNRQLRAKVVALQGELAEAELAAAEKGRP